MKASLRRSFSLNPPPDHQPMPRPERISLRILQKRGMPTDGVTTLAADLGAVFRSLDVVGSDAALLLLTMRALRQRSGGRMALRDLEWIMQASRATVGTWLDRLGANGLLVYDRTNGTIDVEFPESAALSPSTEAAAPFLPIRHELPTHWFIHVLPRIGRRAFLVYLYLLTCDGRSAPSTVEIWVLARETALPSVLHARWSLWRLTRAGLIRREGRGMVVHDPPPLTPSERRWLRLRRRIGAAPLRWLWLAAAVVLLLVVAAAFLILPGTTP
jgi:hypothetical protein